MQFSVCFAETKLLASTVVCYAAVFLLQFSCVLVFNFVFFLRAVSVLTFLPGILGLILIVVFATFFSKR